jgi:hypothetical protein
VIRKVSRGLFLASWALQKFIAKTTDNFSLGKGFKLRVGRSNQMSERDLVGSVWIGLVEKKLNQKCPNGLSFQIRLFSNLEYHYREVEDPNRVLEAPLLRSFLKKN